MLPQDPMILLSYVNTKPRDDYTCLEELSGALDGDRDELVGRLEGVNYSDNLERNQFI